jgi:hypothetical protein
MDFDPYLALIQFIGYLSGFTILDNILTILSFQSPYYAVHAIHNGYIVYSTWDDVVTTFTDFKHLALHSPNYDAAIAVAALHLYHILMYRKNFRLDDWLHHILMIFVALPIGFYVQSSTLLGFSLFFSTGLSGGIDYVLLFLSRNGLLSRGIQKRVNRWLSVWIRSPGCVSHAALNVAYAFMSGEVGWPLGISLIPAALMYWNGQYFMQQVVADQAKYAIEQARQEAHEA